MMTGEGGVFRGEVLREHLQSWGARGTVKGRCVVSAGCRATAEK